MPFTSNAVYNCIILKECKARKYSTLFIQKSCGINVETQSALITQVLRTGLWKMDQKFQGYPGSAENVLSSTLTGKFPEQLRLNHRHTLRVGPRPTGGSPVAA
jgi:hypothetical protein